MELRATVIGLAELLQAKVPYDDAELEQHVTAAWEELVPPPKLKASLSTDPYRNAPGSDPAADDEAAKQLLELAERHHFAREFTAARAVDQQIIEEYAGTKQAGTARQQLDNLRGQ